MVNIIYLETTRESVDRLQGEVGGILASRGVEFSLIACSSIQAVEYAVYREKDAVVLMNERRPSGERFSPWDIAGLRDISRVRVIACVDRIRYGTPFMAVLYAGGVVDALYEDDSDSRRIADLIQNGRGRSESRAYYGIASMEELISVLQVMDQETLARYIRYIEAGADKEEMIARYQEVTKKMGCVEECCLASNVPEEILGEIKGNMPERFKPPQAGKRGRLRIF